MRFILAALVFLLVSGAVHETARAARGDITLLGAMSLPNSAFVSDVWGYESGGREYAIIGDWQGHKVFIIDVTNPAAMFIASEVPNAPSFDLKVWDHYLYLCDGDAGGLDSRVVDIQDPLNPVMTPYGFYSAHNISISATGMMTLEYYGVRLLDLIADPERPTLLKEIAGDGHDSTPHGSRLYDFRGRDGTFVLDVSNPSAPAVLASIIDPAISYSHSGDATPDGNYLFICDELASNPSADVTVWDISTLAAPFRVASIADAGATVHNLYVVGNLAYSSYYSSGFKVLDVTDPSSPSVLDTWDTSQLAGEGFIGAFGVYPFAPGNRVYVSDIDNGLFVFSVDTTSTVRSTKKDTPAPRAIGATLAQNAPNPFHPSTSIAFEIDSAGPVSLTVYDARGQRVQTLVDAPLSEGTHIAEWDGRGAAGSTMAAGVYFYRLATRAGTLTRRMVLLK